GLEVLDELRDALAIGTRPARRRHQPDAKLVDDAFPDRRRRSGRVEHLHVEHETALAIERVMAVSAVLPDDVAMLRERRIRRAPAARGDERETRRDDESRAE